MTIRAQTGPGAELPIEGAGVGWEIREGDALERLREMPDASVQCCVTSPPYFGLRDYGTGAWDGGDDGCDHTAGRGGHLAESAASTRGGGHKMAEAQTVPYGPECGKCGARRTDRQLGLEATPDEYVAKLVEVFREVRRVLRDDGTLWLNIGDSYAGTWGNQGRKAERGTQRPINGEMLTPVLDGRYPSQASGTGTIPKGADYKAKDLLGIPWLLAFALRADGWYLRSDVIWAKPNPMPESVTDRPTSAYEHVFLLSKSARYFYDADAIREDASTFGRQGSERDDTGAKNGSIDPHWHRAPLDRYEIPGRNKRNVWEIATQPFSFDALQGGSAYKASPDCPTHGLRACPERWRTAADGGSQDHYQYRIDSTDARRALGLLDATDATTSHNPGPSQSGVQSSAPSRTSRSMGESRTPTPSSGASGSASDGLAHHTTRTETSNGHPLDSQDSRGHVDASTASGHSTESRRSGSSSASRDSGDVEPGDRTQYTSSPDAQPAQDGSDSPATSQTPGRSRGRCTCTKYSVDHFATFPCKLVEPCILAGSSPKACGECGAPWVRVVEVDREWASGSGRAGNFPTGKNGANLQGGGATGDVRMGPTLTTRTIGWQPSCAHTDDTGHSIILDPFAGSGTTGLVALRHDRSFIGIELSLAYAEMARNRIRDDAPLLNSHAEATRA